MKKSIIITAGGIGKRMQTDVPKQFLLLGNKPVLIHTLERFYSFDPTAQLLITLPSDWFSYWEGLLAQYNVQIAHQLIDGGKERFHSIQNALQYCAGEYIAVHDGVRPLVSNETIERCFSGLKSAEAVVPVLPAKDSIRKGTFNASFSVNRSEYFLVHTPQCFHAAVLKKAYAQPFDSSFTDDASVVESIGIQPILVLSNEENLKITSPIDLQLLNALLN
ncbi:MAG: 2-C-methyl-D-erythritol 4-phosphate cytidylyltransferase [Flavobacteriales bacterium]